MLEGEERAVIQQRRQRKIGRVVAVAVHHHEASGSDGLCKPHKLLRRYPLPSAVETAPAGDAVDVRSPLDLRERRKLLPGENPLSTHATEKTESPILQFNPWGVSVGQHRPFAPPGGFPTGTFRGPRASE